MTNAHSQLKISKCQQKVNTAQPILDAV